MVEVSVSTGPPSQPQCDGRRSPRGNGGIDSRGTGGFMVRRVATLGFSMNGGIIWGYFGTIWGYLVKRFPTVSWGFKPLSWEC